MEAEKRGMGMNDYNGDMRKGGRGGGVGMAYRPPGSKEAAPGDAGSYYDKVTSHCSLCSLIVLIVLALLMSFSCLEDIVSFITLLYFLL